MSCDLCGLQPSEWYNASEFSPAGNPYGFFFDYSHDDTPAQGFPVLLDVNLGQSRASQFLQYLQVMVGSEGEGKDTHLSFARSSLLSSLCDLSFS